MVPKKVDKDVKKEQILESALRVFAEKGYNATLMNDIAKMAGIGKGTIYEYFKSKDHLFFEAFIWFCDRMFEPTIKHILETSDSASARLEKLVLSLMGIAKTMENLIPLSFEFWSASASGENRDKFEKEFREMYDQYRSLISGIIKDGIKQGEFRSDIDADAVSSGLLGAMDGIHMQGWFDAGIDIEQISREFVKCLINGMSCKLKKDKKKTSRKDEG